MEKQLEQSTKDEFIITKTQFAAIVNTIARHESELRTLNSVLHKTLDLIRQQHNIIKASL